jgi:nucleotide-binding universal stress UspA family protein
MKILVATDGSKFSQSAIEAACDVARGKDEVCFKVVTAYEPPAPIAAEPYGIAAGYYQQLEENARQNAETAAAKGVDLIKSLSANSAPCVTTVVELGRPAKMIVDLAESWGADLIVVGSHGHGFWGRLALGSVSDAVAHHAPCSVLIVKSPSKGAKP